MPNIDKDDAECDASEAAQRFAAGYNIQNTSIRPKTYLMEGIASILNFCTLAMTNTSCMELSDNQRLCTVLREQADLAATLYEHNRHLYWFVRAYHCITEEQAWHICNNHFRETGLLTDIIVRFHELYYSEIQNYLQTGSCAPHWEKVFRSAGNPTKPFDFTLSNLYQGLRILRLSILAHVNTDLRICLREYAFEISMRKPTFEQDYLVMNHLLHKAAIRFSREMLAAFQPRFVSFAQLYHLVTAGFTHRWIIQVRMKAYHSIAA